MFRTIELYQMLFFINFESLFNMNIVDYVFVNPNGNYS